MSRTHSVAKTRWAIPLIVALATPFFFVGGPGPTSVPMFPALWNLGHIAFFALAVFWLRRYLPTFRDSSRWRLPILVSCAVLVLGLAIEFAQSGLCRDPDLHDIWRNLLGSWLGWFMPGSLTKGRKLALTLLSLLIAVELALIGQVYWLDRQLQKQTPVIAGLESEKELMWWTGDVAMSREIVAFGQVSLKVSLETTKYSGTSLKHFPKDWRGYQTLKFAICNPETTPLLLTLRVSDKAHERQSHVYGDRFNTSLAVQPGWSHYDIPLETIRNAPADREMDMENIFRIMVFARDLPSPRTVFLDYFRLE